MKTDYRRVYASCEENGRIFFGQSVPKNHVSIGSSLSMQTLRNSVLRHAIKRGAYYCVPGLSKKNPRMTNVELLAHFKQRVGL